MKKTVFLWILRYLLIPVGFIWATEINDGIVAIEKSKSRPDPWETFSKDEIATLCIDLSNFRIFTDSLLKSRERHIEETGFYEPYLYFCDLKQFKMFEFVFRDTLNNTYEGRFIFLGLSEAKNRFVALRDNNWSWRKFENLEKCRTDSVEGSMSITEAQHFWFPKVKIRETEIAEMYFMEDVGWPVIYWFFRFYLKGLPFAFMLFLFWRFRFKEEVDEACYGEMRERLYFDIGFAPLSFFFSLLFWPFVLLADIKNRLMESLMKAEVLSRRKEMLSLLSRQDKKLVALSKQMSLREFRVHLDSIGMRRRHSFTSALFVVVFFVSIHRTFSSPSYQLFGSDTVICTIVCSGDTDVGWNYSLFDYLDEYSILPTVGWTEKVLKFKSIFSSCRIKAVAGYLRKLEGVPKFLNQFSFF